MEKSNAPTPEIEGPEDAAPEEGAAKETERSHPKWLMLVLPLILATAGGASITFLGYESVASYAAIFTEADSSETSHDSTEVNYGAFSEIEQLIVNPAQTAGRRYLMVDIGFESKDAKALEELESKEIVVRDLLIRNLSIHTVAYLADIDNRQRLKDQLRGKVNDVLQHGHIERLYFTRYVLQ